MHHSVGMRLVQGGCFGTQIEMNIASAIVEGEELRLRHTVPPLQPYLGCFWAIETTAATRLRTLPDGCAAPPRGSRRNRFV